MRKIKIISVALVAFALAAFALVGCSSGGSSSSSAASSSSSASASSSAAASSSSAASASASSSATSSISTLVVGFDAEFPPYGYVGDDGKYTGVDLDLAQEVCKRNGWEFKAEPIDWNAKDALLNAGTINCIWNGFTIEGREADYTFSDPYMLNEQVLVVKAGSDIKSINDLAGKTVMTQTGSAGEELLTDEEGDFIQTAKTFAGGGVQTLGDYNNIFMQLDSGMCDAVVCDLSVFGHQSAGANASKYSNVQTLSSEHFGVGFKKGEDALAKTVNDTLKAMYADGTVAKILEKYADQNVSIDNWLLK